MSNIETLPLSHNKHYLKHGVPPRSSTLFNKTFADWTPVVAGKDGMIAFHEKYWDLLWYARSDLSRMDSELAERMTAVHRRIEKTYPIETAKLNCAVCRAETYDFISGCLATSCFFMGQLTEDCMIDGWDDRFPEQTEFPLDSREESFNDFPFLDT